MLTFHIATDQFCSFLPREDMRPERARDEDRTQPIHKLDAVLTAVGV